ncbi:CAP family protein [Streptomyces sp. NPDC004539]|uniref:CAP family protein n=1 Tax=Streptomyces sp. NPDC004539 TaxID=3154280 RepID=UPI0033BF9F1F
MRTMTRRATVRCALTTLVAAAATLTLAAPAAPRATGFDQQILDRSNAHRAAHNAPDLTLDPKLSAWAQDWADKMAATGRFEHRPHNEYGENLHYAWRSDGSGPTGEEVVDGWYAQVRDYHSFGAEPDMSTFKKWGLFTQLVWKSSTRIGVGRATTSDGKTYVVVDYDPPGNYTGRFTANVLPRA